MKNSVIIFFFFLFQQKRKGQNFIQNISEEIVANRISYQLFPKLLPLIPSGI